MASQVATMARGDPGRVRQVAVDGDDAAPVDGYEIAAGEQDCTLRLLVTPDRRGRIEAGLVEVRLRYGPGGLLRRTASVRPAVVLDVTETGPDPRASSD